MSEFNKVQLSSSGSPGFLDTFSDLFIVVVHYTYQHIIVDYSCRVSYSLHQGLGQVAQENSTKQTAYIFCRGSATASFGLGNSFPGVATLPTKESFHMTSTK